MEDLFQVRWSFIFHPILVTQFDNAVQVATLAPFNLLRISIYPSG